MERGILPGGGPFVNEDRVIELDLSQVAGDRFSVRIRPPLGFWSIDYVGVDYEATVLPQMTPAPLTTAYDADGSDVSSRLRSADQDYEILKETGNWFTLTFDAPPQEPGTSRTVFLKTSGYYQLHGLPTDRPEQTELLEKLVATPGLIVRYAMERYQEEARSRSPLARARVPSGSKAR